MIQRYSLIESLPDIPTPHDCVINKIIQDNDCIIFEFENNITKHDSARFYCPTAKSLQVRYFMPEMDFNLYQEKTRKKKGDYVSTYTSMQSEDLFQLTERKYKLEYLYHYVSYKSMILILWSGQEFRLEFPQIDHVEYNWIE